MENKSAIVRVWSSLRSATGVRIELVLIVAIVVGAVALFPDLRVWGRTGLVEFSEMGPFAPLALIASYAVVAALLLPAFPLDLAAGAHFGFIAGVLWVQVAALIAAAVGYQVGRTFLRGLLERLIRWKPKLARIDHAVAQDGWRIVFLTRLSPVFSFSLLNAFYGATRVPVGPYLLASFAGMLPGTALYVYAGVMAGDLSGAPGRPARTPWQWGFEIAGFVATAAIVVYGTRRAQRILESKLGDADSPPDPTPPAA